MAPKGDEAEQSSAPGAETRHTPRRPKQPKEDIVAKGVVIKPIVMGTKQVRDRVDIGQDGGDDNIISDAPVGTTGIGDQPAKCGVAFKVHSVRSSMVRRKRQEDRC